MVFVYGMYELITDAIDCLKVYLHHCSIIFTYKILTVCALCIIHRKDIALQIESHLSKNNTEKIQEEFTKLKMSPTAVKKTVI